MSRLHFIQFYIDAFKQKGRTRYLAVNMSREYVVNHAIDGVFHVEEFRSKKDLEHFMKNDVAKSEVKDWKIYVETVL